MPQPAQLPRAPRGPLVPGVPDAAVARALKAVAAGALSRAAPAVRAPREDVPGGARYLHALEHDSSSVSRPKVGRELMASLSLPELTRGMVDPSSGALRQMSNPTRYL